MPAKKTSTKSSAKKRQTPAGPGTATRKTKTNTTSAKAATTRTALTAKTARSDAPVESDSIVGPDRLARSDPQGPEFFVTVRPDRYWAIEIATDPELFPLARKGAEMDPTKFFATWNESSALLTAQSAKVFSLPHPVWLLLRANQTLFYRLSTSTQERSWENSSTTPPRRLELFGNFDRDVGPLTRPEENRWRTEPSQ
jgi:hypothetical protein